MDRQNRRPRLGHNSPPLAWMADHSRTSAGVKPPHFAVVYKITNNPGPSTPTYKRSDGREAKLVIVDDRGPIHFSLGMALNIMEWWPRAQSNTVAGKLQRRIMRTGLVLPVAATIAGALLSEIYTTTSAAGSSKTRIRLKYRSSPIADFGICRGSVRVDPSDRLLFYSLGRKQIIDGQNPDDHYWLYFTSLKGEEVYLDFSMHPFNFTHVLQTIGYPPPNFENTNIGLSPCLWTERELLKRGLSLYTERSRICILRNSDLQHMVKQNYNEWSDKDLDTLYNAMESFSQKPLTKQQKDFVRAILREHCKNLSTVLETEQWKRYPKKPMFAFELDPGQKIKGLNA